MRTFADENEVARLTDQLERGFRGDAWHGPPLRSALTGVDAAVAAERQLSGVHSIWELTTHVTFWMDVVRRRLAGEVVPLQDGDDWAVIDTRTSFRWRDALAALDANHERLRSAVSELSPQDLERVVPDMGYTNYVMLHGVLQHNIYHAGQIAMLVKASRPY
ncbi:MAG TPA: DinB family protein [Gemmatimonadales bacterium]|jgi:uncharacterized damage-inducible protein DinB